MFFKTIAKFSHFFDLRKFYYKFDFAKVIFDEDCVKKVEGSGYWVMGNWLKILLSKIATTNYQLPTTNYQLPN
ncbi:MAG: hypothetical protein AAF630_19480 [Cyanobacteria bacterium P01_C01_bin.38]